MAEAWLALCPVHGLASDADVQCSAGLRYVPVGRVFEVVEAISFGCKPPWIPSQG